jgi:hypothetical protein
MLSSERRPIIFSVREFFCSAVRGSFVVNPIQRARILLIADPAYGHSLLDRLRLLKSFKVNRVDGIEEARRLCEAGAADACLVVVRNSAPDDFWLSQVEASAPGRDCGVPSLLVADVVDPYVMDVARRSGYAGAVPITKTARLLYRSIGAMLQQARQPRAVIRAREQAQRPRPVWTGVIEPLNPAGGHMPTLH